MKKICAANICAKCKPELPTLSQRKLEGALRAGDVVFTRIPGAPFRQIADATGTWTNHVGIVVGFNAVGAVVAESRVPFSCRTRFTNFVRRSAQGRMAVLRLPRPLSDEEIQRLRQATGSRLGRLYDTGFSHIPWERITVTPQSLYASPSLNVVFDGILQRGSRTRAPDPTRH